MRHVYLDYNATTPVLPEVLEVMLRYYRDAFGNPSSVHRYGREARIAVDEARDSVARLLHAPASAITFCSGGTEANNTIIKGVAAARCERGRHIVTSQIEHPCVLDACAYLARQGYRVTYVPVSAHGIVDPEAVHAALTDDTILVSIMHANNEVGTLQPIAEIARLTQARGIVLHTDAVQSVGKVPLDVTKLGADFVTFSGHKLYAPKGIGGWYARSPAPLHPLLHGGHQERGWRSGTENVAAMAALGQACDLAWRDMPQEGPRQRQLQQMLEDGLQKRVPHIRIQGGEVARLPNTTNVAFAHVEGETLLMSLDLQGVYVSTGSACSSGSLEPSHVLQAMGVPAVYLGGALRLSLGRGTSQADILYVLEILQEVVERARALSSRA